MDIQSPGLLDQRAKLKHFDIQATVHRADGTTEEYGVIAGWDRNIFKHVLLQIQIYITRLKINWSNR